MIKSGAGLSTIGIAVPFTNSGTLEILEGTLRFDQSFTQSDIDSVTLLTGGGLSRSGTTATMQLNGGVLSGAGTIALPIVNAATIRPGGPLGTLAITGTYTQTAAGRLEIELGGNPASESNDRLAISGAATLNGTLAIIIAGGHTPAAGENTTILSFASRSGDFATFEGLSTGGFTLMPSAGATSYTLVVQPF
jgi:hypothetical protein